jgi:TRAP-type transport system small permease protein
VLERAFDAFIKAIEQALALAFIFAVCLNFVNVVGRYGLGRTLLWADEVQIYIMVWMAFLGAVVASWRNIHLRMDVLVRRLPGRLQSVLAAFEMLFILVLVGFVMWHSWDYLRRIFMLEQKSDVAGIPMAIPHSALVLGFALIALVTVWRGARRAMNREREAAPQADGRAR